MKLETVHKKVFTFLDLNIKQNYMLSISTTAI